MARTLGDAFVAIRATGASQFTRDTQTIVTTATRSATGDVQIGAVANTSQIAAKIASIKALIAQTTRGANDLSVGLNDKGLIAKTAALQASLSALGDRTLNIKANVSDAGLARLSAQALAADASLEKLQNSLTAGNDVVDESRRSYGLFGTVMDTLSHHVQLFGGVLSNTALPEILTSVSGYHLLLESIIELTATWVPAAIAVSAFGIASISTFKSLYSHMSDMVTVSSALGEKIYPLTNNFTALSAAAKPYDMVLFGEALELMGQKSSFLTDITKATGQALDQLGARFVGAMSSAGKSTSFATVAAHDVLMLGTGIGDLIGILGNFLKVTPGFAEPLLTFGTAVLGAAEDITGSGFVQSILKMTLTAHGLIIYSGLAASAVWALRTPILAVAGWVGSAVEAVAKFGMMFTAVAAEEGVLAAATATLDGVMAALGAVNPFVWVAAGVAALTGLVVWLARGTDATASFDAAISKAVTNAQFADTLATIGAGLQATTTQIKATNAELAKTPEYMSVATASTGKSGDMVREITPAYAALSAQLAGYKGELSSLDSQQASWNNHMAIAAKISGSAKDAMSLVNEAGITQSQMLDSSSSGVATYTTELKGIADANQAVTQSSGRFGAAMIALNNPLTTLDATMSKITDAQSALMTTITGGESAFVTFQQGINTLGTDSAASQSAMTGLSKSSSWADLKSAAQQLGVSIAGVGTQSKAFEILETAAKNAQSSVGGLNATSLQMSSDFYTGVTNAQGMINSLEQQGVSTKNLTKVVATQASEMLQYAGNNVAARATIISLINDAVGPGTTNFKNLDEWVSHNSTSMSGLNQIVAQTTVAASAMAGTIDQLTKNLFSQELATASGVTPAVRAYADALEKANDVAGARTARQELIADLIKSGLSAQTAQGYVANLTKGLKGLPSQVSTQITDSVTGNGTIKATQSITGQSSQMIGQLKFVKDGGHITGPGGPTADRIPAMLSNGEFVVNATSVKRLGLPAMNAINRYAAGGPVGNGFSSAENALSQIVPASNAASALFAQNVGTAFAKAAQSSASASASGGNISTAGLSGTLIQIVEEIAKEKGWNDSQISAWERVIMRESGGNMNARNKSSGAFGLAQFINGAGEYSQYGGNSGTMAGQLVAMASYIQDRYKTPAAAWAHEISAGWYSKGGLVPRSKAHRGFAAGGVINEPVLGTGLSSGMSYSFGEGGRVENVTSDQNSNQNQPTHTGQMTTNQILQGIYSAICQQNQISQQTTNPAVGRSLRTTAIKR